MRDVVLQNRRHEPDVPSYSGTAAKSIRHSEFCAAKIARECKVLLDELPPSGCFIGLFLVTTIEVYNNNNHLSTFTGTRPNRTGD